MRFKASNDTFIHWLTNWRSVCGYENRLNVCQVWNGRMRSTVVNDKRAFIHAGFPMKFTESVCEDLTIHPTLLLCDLLAGQLFNIFKTARVSRFAYNKNGKIFPCSTCCPYPGYSNSAFFPLGTLFPFEVIGKALAEAAKIISIIYIFQLIIWQYGRQGCFIPGTGHFICNRFAHATDNF